MSLRIGVEMLQQDLFEYLMGGSDAKDYIMKS